MYSPLFVMSLSRGTFAGEPTANVFKTGCLATSSVPRNCAMRASLHRNPAYPIAQLREKVLRERTDIAVLEQAYFAPAADRANSRKNELL